MPTRLVKRPGTAGRATAAFALLNLPLVVTVGAVYWLAGGIEAEWWLRGIIGVAVAVSEAAITLNTIGPPLMEWIKGEEYVEEGKDPSWKA